MLILFGGTAFMADFKDDVIKPPSCNTGALSTSKSRTLLDWCGFTVATEKQAFDSLHIPKESFSLLETGGMGYSKSYILGHIKVFFDGSADMGCHVEMSGQACREFEAYNIQWSNVVAEVFASGGKFSRIDLAHDDFQNRLKLTTMEGKIKRGAVRSVFKKARSLKEYLLKDGSYTGKTLYFGSKMSLVQIRVYDKTLEQINKGKENVLENWVRIEMQCRDERAQAIASHILFDEGKDIGTLYKQFLSYYVNFLIKNSDDTNKSRWRICEWWTDFLDGLEGMPLALAPKPRTIEKITKWVLKQVVPSLAMLSVDSNGKLQNLENVFKLTMAGVSRLKTKDFEVIKNFEHERKLKQDMYNAISKRRNIAGLNRNIQRRFKRPFMSPFSPGVSCFKFVIKKRDYIQLMLFPMQKGA